MIKNDNALNDSLLKNKLILKKIAIKHEYGQRGLRGQMTKHVNFDKNTNLFLLHMTHEGRLQKEQTLKAMMTSLLNGFSHSQKDTSIISLSSSFF